MDKDRYEKLLIELPRISDVVKQFPEALHEKTFTVLLQALTGDKTTKVKQPPDSPPPDKDKDRNLGNMLPTVADLAVKGIVGSETEWILVMAHYRTLKNNKGFTIEEIRGDYKDAGRYKAHNRGNFTTNFNKCHKKYFRETAPPNLTLTVEGRDSVAKILARKQEVKKPARKKNANRVAKVDNKADTK